MLTFLNLSSCSFLLSVHEIEWQLPLFAKQKLSHLKIKLNTDNIYIEIQLLYSIVFTILQACYWLSAMNFNIIIWYKLFQILIPL